MQNLLERAQQLIQLQRYKDAEKELRVLLTQDPNQVDALALLSLCLAEQDQLQDALKIVQNAISQQPDNDHLLYLQALYLFRLEKITAAEKSVQNAIAYQPRNADYFGLLASIKLYEKEFTKSLEYANEGLAIDPDNLQCLNMRSTSLFKLNKKDEAYATIQEALNQDPENDGTHANLGWGLLERGDPKKALVHFREALKLNPNSEYAKAGLIEGLKARYFFYRLFLKYAFWISNLQGKAQWGVIIGLYVCIRLLDYVADNNPSLVFIIKPIVYVYIAFALSTWVITPLSNLFLRLNVYGRFALSQDQIRASNYVGLAFMVGIPSILAYLIFKTDFLLVTGVVGITLMIPLSSMFNPPKPRSKKIMIGYTMLLVIVGLLNILLTGLTGTVSILFPIHVFGVVIYGWVANAMIIR